MTIPGENELLLTCRPRADGVEILRCETADPAVRLPDEIGGKPVTALGPYALSARPPVLHDTDGLFSVRVTWGGTPPVHDARAIETVILPAGLRVIGRYAFYDCRALSAVTLPVTAREIAQGAFMNCLAFRTVRLTGPADAPSGLEELLGQTAGEVEIELDTPEGEGRLLFPAYHEELESLDAAHIFQRRIEGAGYAYRQCFTGGVLGFAQYDDTIERLTRLHAYGDACRVALLRLRWPLRLRPAARERYRALLADHCADALTVLLDGRDTAGLSFLLSLPDIIKSEAIDAACAKARETGQTEALALLLGRGRAALGAAGRKTYDL